MLLLGSCNGEQPDGGFPLQGTSGEAPLSVRSLATGTAAVTRAAADGSTKALDESTGVGFYVQALTTDGKTYYQTQNNVPGGYDTEDLTWQPSPATPVWLNNRTAQLAVYAPYDATQNNTNDGILNLNAALRTDANDLAAGRFSANNKSMDTPGISITMERLYARVVFTFIKYANYTAAATIGKIAWDGGDIYKTAAYDLFCDAGHSADAYTIDKSDANRNLAYSFTPGLAVGTDKTADAAARADLLLIPTGADFTQDGVLTVTASTTTALSSGTIVSEEKVMSVPVPKSLFSGDRKLGAGKQFNITVRLSLADIIIEESDVKLTDWEDAATDVESKLD